MTAYEPASTHFNPEWDTRMKRLLDRGLSPRASNIVLNAAMYGIGCIEGEMRAKIEADKTKEPVLQRKSG